MFVCVCMSYVRECTWKPKESVGSPEARDIGSCELTIRVLGFKLSSSGRAGSVLNC